MQILNDAMCAVCRDAASAEIEGSGDRECTVAEPKLMAGYTDVVSIRTSVACVAPGGVRRQGGVDMYVEKRTFGFAGAGESLFPSSDVLNLISDQAFEGITRCEYARTIR